MHCRLDARNVAVVVCAPKINQLAEAAIEFVFVIGDVCGKVSGLAVLANDHAVFVVAEF